VEAAREAAAKMGGYEEYAEYLEPFPDHVLMGDEVRDYVLFADGWYQGEEEGRWSEGKVSRIYLKVPPEHDLTRLYIHGRYYGAKENTRVFVNSSLVSEEPLTHHNIELPEHILDDEILEIEFQHINPEPVGEKEETGDQKKQRNIKFFLVRIHAVY
jgi:hypothetical protein